MVKVRNPGLQVEYGKYTFQLQRESFYENIKLTNGVLIPAIGYWFWDLQSSVKLI